jgi:hypothetical protein
MAKKKTRRTLFLILIAILSGLIFLYVKMYSFVGFELGSPSLMILSFPDPERQVYLYEKGFQDRNISLCIPSYSHDYFRQVARWSTTYFWEAIWSKDGSVLAMKFNDYFLAYDFKTGRTIPEQKGKEISIELNPSTEIPLQIQALIRERGGPKYVIPCSNYAFVRLQYSKWRKFEAALTAGKQAPPVDPNNPYQ